MTRSPKELVLAQVQHQETEPIPYTLEFEGKLADDLDAHYGSSDWRALLDNAIRQVPTPNLSVVGGAGTFYIDWYGSRWRVDRRPYHLVEPALKTPSLTGFEFPMVDTVLTPGWTKNALRAIEQEKDYFLVAGFGFGLFERTWALRGFDEAMMDAAGNPGFYDELVEAVTNHQLDIIERLLELPVDGIMFSDDWGYQNGVLLGPERWRRVLKPRLARMYARVHESGKVVLSHCCGSIADIMPDLIEIGLDVYESVQPEAKKNDPYQLKREYGDQITFWGGLGSQSTIPFGTPDDIKAEVARLCREMGRGGGYILSPAKALQPGTPTENAAAVVEAFLGQAGARPEERP
jgi:uroporphyrinogen decarboxylase